MIITASIVTFHNSHNDLKKVFNSFLNSTIDVLLFVVDNSSNRSIECLVQDERIIYTYNNANLGFGKAHNIAINESKKIGSLFHFIVNPDIEFESKVISRIIEKFLSCNEIGLIMPKIVYPDGSIQHLRKLIPTPFDLFIRRFVPFNKLVEWHNENYELRFLDQNVETEVPCLSGCFMAIRMDVLTDVSGFDEQFFMYMEDVDLCRRIGEKLKLIYYPDVCVIHEYEKGSYKNIKLLKHHLLSAIIYFNKWGWFFDKKRNLINSRILKRRFTQ